MKISSGTALQRQASGCFIVQSRRLFMGGLGTSLMIACSGGGSIVPPGSSVTSSESGRFLAGFQNHFSTADILGLSLEPNSTAIGSYTSHAFKRSRTMPLHEITDARINAFLESMGVVGYERTGVTYQTPASTARKFLSVAPCTQSALRIIQPLDSCPGSFDVYWTFDNALTPYDGSIDFVSGNPPAPIPVESTPISFGAFAIAYPTFMIYSSPPANTELALGKFLLRCNSQVAAAIGSTLALASTVIQYATKFPGALSLAKTFVTNGATELPVAVAFLTEVAILLGPVGWLALLGLAALSYAAFLEYQKCAAAGAGS